MSAVAFDFEDVLPTVRRAHSAATRDDAEDAIQIAAMELHSKGTPLTAANIVTRARSRLITMKGKREARNLSLDAYLESDEDSAPVELAVEEVDYEIQAELSAARENPILRQRLGDRIEWSRDLILEAIRAVTREDGRPPSAESMKTDPRLPSITVFYRRFDSWEEAMRLADVDYVTPREAWSREEATETLREWVAEHGRLPTEAELRGTTDNGLPSQAAIYRMFGSVSRRRLTEIVWGEDAGRIVAAMAILRKAGPGRNDDLAARLGEFVGS